MREFWVASGHHLTRLDKRGWMVVTDELLLAWLARPEVLPPPEACAAERALHARLRADPRAPVDTAEIAALADADARENWEFLISLRDTLVGAGTVEAGYLALVRQGRRLPVVFYDQLVQLVLRNALQGCEDVHTLRAAELLFRPQRAHVKDGALMLADAEIVAELEAERHSSPLTAMLGGGVEGLDVLSEANAWTYWSRSDAHTMVLNFGGDPQARQGLAVALSAFVTHLLGHSVLVAPKPGAEGVDLRWFVGLDQTGTAIGNALWKAEPPPAAMVGLFTLDFLDPAPLLPEIQGHPIWLIMGLPDDMSIRLKPQNLVMGLPLAPTAQLH
ncbi:DUF6352 family protein [Plastorhodobacter daqingensis]|uniref:DUF6352 family protein n=1 Tax=Plastorhodobacter daqingensis TaxID=1387281 RepID=A0ABW2UMB8_9RHOB